MEQQKDLCFNTAGDNICFNMKFLQKIICSLWNKNLYNIDKKHPN